MEKLKDYQILNEEDYIMYTKLLVSGNIEKGLNMGNTLE